MSDDGIVSKGATIAGGTVGALGQVTGARINGGPVEEIDITTLASTIKATLAGTPDAGSMEIDLRYTQAGLDKIYDNVGLVAEVWTITLSNLSTITFSGYISTNPQVTISGGMPVDISFTVKLTSAAVCAPAA